nr:ribonuclease H-like domain-containing protein [Tanacetum cinerariifolium]
MFVHGFTDNEFVADDPITLISRLDISNPLHLHPSNSIVLTVIFVKLKGTENYQVWSYIMLLALEGKNKIGFIDDLCRRGSFQENQTSTHTLRPSDVLLIGYPADFRKKIAGQNFKGKNVSNNNTIGSSSSSRDDVLFSPNNEDKVFNPGILSHEKSVKIITRVTQEKKLAVSFASWLFEDFDLPFSELLVFKEVPNSMRLLPFSSKNEEKPNEDFSCSKWKEYSSLGCSSVPFLSLLIRSSMGGIWSCSFDLKQALRERHPMLIILVFPDL